MIAASCCSGIAATAQPKAWFSAGPPGSATPRSGHLAFVQPDVGKWGGISGCREVASRAKERGVTFCPHWLGGGVGLAASLHLLAAVGTHRSYGEVDANPNPLREEVFEMRVRDGTMTLDDAPGLGIEPDPKQLARYLVSRS